MSASPSPSSQRLGTPTTPAIRFTRGLIFRGFMVRISLRPTKLLAPLHGSDRALPSQRELLPPGFQRDKCPLLDMTTTVTGLLCWRDFHPQEWQLASLHENLIKLHKAQLSSDRMSCHSATANQVRLVLHTAAFWLMHAVRAAIPRTSPLAGAEFATIRERLIKIGARVLEHVARIRIHLPTSCPEAALFRTVALGLLRSGP